MASKSRPPLFPKKSCTSFASLDASGSECGHFARDDSARVFNADLLPALPAVDREYHAVCVGHSLLSERIGTVSLPRLLEFACGAGFAVFASPDEVGVRVLGGSEVLRMDDTLSRRPPDVAFLECRFREKRVGRFVRHWRGGYPPAVSKPVYAP